MSVHVYKLCMGNQISLIMVCWDAIPQSHLLSLILLCLWEGVHRIQVIAAAKKKLSDLMTAAEASIFELPPGPFDTRHHPEIGSRVPPKGRRLDEEFNKSASFTTSFYYVMFSLSIILT
jgi:hypothetical protein